MKKAIINILIVAVIIAATIFIQNKYFPTVVTNTTIIKDTFWKDTGSVSYVPKPYPIFRDTGSVQIIELPADSAAITKAYLKLHKDFYSTYFYQDTVVNDSAMFIEVGSEITQNKPVKYNINWYDKTPTIINNTTNVYSKNELYLGLSVGVNQISPSILFKSRNNLIFGAGYNIQTNSVEGKAYINIDKIKIW
jgi:hypothetical protein